MVLWYRPLNRPQLLSLPCYSFIEQTKREHGWCFGLSYTFQEGEVPVLDSDTDEAILKVQDKGLH